MSITNGYWQPDTEAHTTVVSVKYLQEEASRILPKNGYDYIVGGSGDE